MYGQELTENNKRYKERLDGSQQQQQQLHILEKTLSTQIADRDRLIGTLQDVIEEHETKILQLEQEVHGLYLLLSKSVHCISVVYMHS